MAKSRDPGLTISCSAICRTSSCFEQQVAIFSSCSRCACVVLSTVSPSGKILHVVCLVHLSGLQANLCFMYCSKLKNSQDTENPDASLDNRLSWFYVKLLGCLFTRLNYTSCLGSKLPFSEWRL